MAVFSNKFRHHTPLILYCCIHIWRLHKEMHDYHLFTWMGHRSRESVGERALCLVC